jgi:hypothetical protein
MFILIFEEPNARYWHFSELLNRLFSMSAI